MKDKNSPQSGASEEAPVLITSREAARLMGYRHTCSVRRLAQRGALRAYKLNRITTRFDLADVKRFIAEAASR